MAWTTPRTWSDEELVTAALLNEQLRDNLTELKNPPSDNYECDEASDYTTTSTSFVAVDSTNLKLTLNTNGGDVMVHFHGCLNGSTGRVFLDVYVDDDHLEAGDDGITRCANATMSPVSFTRLITGLEAGEHTFELHWKVNTGTGTLYSGAGTANSDLHPQFWAREVS